MEEMNYSSSTDTASEISETVSKRKNEDDNLVLKRYVIHMFIVVKNVSSYIL